MTIKMRIRTKLILATFCVVALSLLAGAFFTYYYVTDIIREQSIQYTLTKLSQNAQQIRRIQEQTIKIAEYIYGDMEIYNDLQIDETADMEKLYFQKKSVEEKLKTFTALNDDIMNVVIVRPDGEIFSNHTGFEDFFAGYLKQDWFQELMADRTGPHFSRPHLSYYMNTWQPVISYVIHYNKPDILQRSVAYTLIIDIKYSRISSAFEQSVGLYDRIVLLNGRGEMLYDSDTSGKPLPEGATKFTEDEPIQEDAHHMLIFNRSMKEDWTQVAIISKDRLFAKLNNILYVFLFMIAGSLLIILAIMTPIVSTIMKPLSRMVSAMKRVSEGDLNIRVTIRSGDELEILGSGFNRMVSELKEHVRLSIENEKTKRQMQIKLLMAQINPHFIYNTLNSIIYLSHANRNQDTVKMTQALIGLLQKSIHTREGDFRTTLGDEIQIAKNYLDIQEIRYPGRFEVEWDVDESALDCPVPKMILQPLVENALYHGICAADQIRRGRIRIRTVRQGDKLEISVEDDGKGMSSEKLEQIRWTCAAGRAPDGRSDGVLDSLLKGTSNGASSFASRGARDGASCEIANDIPHGAANGAASVSLYGSSSRGVGLANINERIRYYYGPDFRLEIESEENKGTRVTVRLPCEITGFSPKSPDHPVQPSSPANYNENADK